MCAVFLIREIIFALFVCIGGRTAEKKGGEEIDCKERERERADHSIFKPNKK